MMYVSTTHGQVHRTDTHNLYTNLRFFDSFQTGTQYRSGIYYQDDDQKAVAEASAKALSSKLGEPVVPEIVSGKDTPFYLAETYHQRYVCFFHFLCLNRKKVFYEPNFSRPSIVGKSYLEKGGQSAEKNATETIRCYG